ncbi:MAG: DUF6285 domain-containing protein [Actinomycetota bacterium]|nr:DUF6285 domain-containing protein [Actinomycetota bacterium]MDA3006016.1 DUF6285 domain-containing protein [Actinomycetota bacterium]MDA3033884.1 DUF6285 domain-containing protein [Actinomycetota bacterium]
MTRDDVGLPSIDELLEAVVEWLRSEVVTGSDATIAYRGRVAAHVLDLVRREIAEGAAITARRDVLLRDLSVTDETELALGIRDGSIPIDANLLSTLRRLTDDRLSVDAPDQRRRGGDTDAAS